MRRFPIFHEQQHEDELPKVAPSADPKIDWRIQKLTLLFATGMLGFVVRPELFVRWLHVLHKTRANQVRGGEKRNWKHYQCAGTSHRSRVRFPLGLWKLGWAICCHFLCAACTLAFTYPEYMLLCALIFVARHVMYAYYNWLFCAPRGAAHTSLSPFVQLVLPNKPRCVGRDEIFHQNL